MSGEEFTQNTRYSSKLALFMYLGHFNYAMVLGPLSACGPGRPGHRGSYGPAEPPPKQPPVQAVGDLYYKPVDATLPPDPPPG